MNNIGSLYRCGYGVAQDYAKAMEWYLKAADLGNADSMNDIGHLYYYGFRVTQDRTKAYEWFTKAAKFGNNNATAMLKQYEDECIAGYLLHVSDYSPINCFLT